MRKLVCIFLFLLFLLTAAAAENSMLSLSPVTETIRPGRAVLITFEAPADGNIDLTICNTQGDDISAVVYDYEVTAGTNQIWWNGTWNGVPAPEGSYRLVLTMGEEVSETRISIGSMAPYLTGLTVSDETLTPEAPVTVSFYAGCSGRITIGAQVGTAWQQLASWQLSEGNSFYTWDGTGFLDGTVTLTLQLTDAQGDSSTEEHVTLTLSGFGSAAEMEDDEIVFPEETTEPMDGLSTGILTVIEENVLLDDENDQRKYTPSCTSPYAGTDQTMNYWTLPMDITDEAAVWEMLMQPMTVLDTGSKNGQKTQVTIRKEPSLDSDGVGVVTCLTQGVHILEAGDEWTLIECYSSSFHNSKVKAWNMLVQGYVQTKYLKTIKPDTTMAIVIDKLTQRLYIFKDGALYDTLLVSTGLANAKQPYNETRSGEFLLQCPAVGEFKSDNLYCSMAIRFNSGDLLHEVPHTKLADGGKNYKSTEYKLGTRASHGCIRVQRKTSPKGCNMNWLWNNRKDEMKLVIWEDWQGRQYPYPADDTVLYYNAGKTKSYHTSDKCKSTNKTMTAFTYGELEDEAYKKLTRCDSCAAPLRKAEIDAINESHAVGGDHDPVLTAAQQKCIEALNLYKTDSQTR